MVEELKLAIKVDDDAIEQSLLKQFANAEKMANKVVLTFNNIDLDDKAIEAKFKEMQKMAGKNPIDLSIDKSSIEMLSAISKQLGNIFDIAKGKSIIDSTAIDNGSIQTAISLFEKMEFSIAKIRKVFADVGDGEEFSPLLKMINNVQSSISELATSVKGIGLNMNIDVGSDSEMEAKVQSKIVNALQAYQRLFDHIKMSSAGGQIITDKFFDFDINQYDTMMGKLQAYKKFIDNMRKEAKAQFNGQDVLYQDTEKGYWTQASAAMGQVTKAFNEMKSASDTNPLKDLFGSGDLSEVVSQLGLIVAKLEEISTTASSFKNVFANGFNITASVEEIDKLTNRVKELEDELAKIKLNPVNVDKSNISSENQIRTEQELNNEIERRESILRELYDLQSKLTVGEDFHGNDRYFADALPSEDDIRKADARIKELTGSNNIFDVNQLIEDRNRWLNEVKYSLEEYDNLIKQNNQKAIDDYTSQGLSRIDGAESFFGFENNYNSIASKFAEQREKISLEIGKLYEELDNIPNLQIKDVFQDDDKINTDASTTAIKEESQALEQVSTSAKDAATSKEKFANANKEVKASAESSSTSLNEEKKKFENVGDSAEETKKKLDDVVFKPNTEGFDEIVSKLDIAKDKIEEISKITKSSVWSESQGEYLESYNIKYKNGTSEIRGESSNKKGSNVLRSNEVAYDAKVAEQEAKAVKEVWDKNVKAIQDYMDAVTKLNNLNAKDKGTGKYASQITLQEKNVEELKEKALEARTAITSMINPHDVSLNTWRDYLDVMEKFSQASLGSAESVAKLEDALRKMDFSSLESASTKFESQFKNLSIKPDGDHQFLSWTNDLKELNAKIDEYNSKVKYLKENNIVDGEQVDEVKNLRDEIEKTINVMTKTPQTKRGWTDIGASNAAEKVANILKQNTKMSKEARNAIKAYYDELRSGNPSQPIADILAKVNQLVQKERELGRVGKSFGEIFKEKVIYGGAAQLAGMVGFYDVINIGREAFETIKELDTALVDLKKTTAMNSSQLEEFYFDSNDVAKQMGVTTQAIIDQASAWSRLGYNTKEQSTQMAKLSSQFATISPGMDTDTAQEGLISIMKAWNIDVDDVKSEIMDNINALGNGMAENNQDIVEGMERSAAALASVGTSYEDAFAMFSGIQEVLQNAEVSGRALRSISMRIRGYDESTEELSSDLENITGELIDLTKTAEHTQGVSIFKEGSTTEFKSLVDYFGEINEVWDEMSQKQQNDFLQKAFGKTQAQAGAALIQNYKGVTKSLEIMEGAAGRYIARICSNTYLRIYLIAGKASIGQSYLLFI